MDEKDIDVLSDVFCILDVEIAEIGSEDELVEGQMTDEERRVQYPLNWARDAVRALVLKYQKPK